MKRQAKFLITLSIIAGILLNIALVAADPPIPPGPPSNPVRSFPAFSLTSLIALGASLSGLAFKKMRKKGPPE